MNQQIIQIDDGLILELVKKGLSWVEDYLHAQQHVCINLKNKNPIEVINDGPYLTTQLPNERLNVKYETIKKELMEFATFSTTNPDKITKHLQKVTKQYDYAFYGNDLLWLFPFGESNAVLFFMLSHYELDKEQNWNFQNWNPQNTQDPQNQKLQDALHDLTRYFELLVYYDYYYTFTFMDVSKYGCDEKESTILLDYLFNENSDQLNKIFKQDQIDKLKKMFNKPITSYVDKNIQHYLLQVAFKQHYLIFKQFYEKCQSVKIDYQTILPIENYRVNITFLNVGLLTGGIEINTMPYTDSRYKSHNQIYNIYQLLTTFNQYVQKNAVLKMKDTYLEQIDIQFLKLSSTQQSYLYRNMIDVQPKLTTMYNTFTKQFGVKKYCETELNTLRYYVYPTNITSKEYIPGIKYVVGRLLNIQFIYHLNSILEQICKYIDKSSLAVYYHLTLLECRNGEDNEMCKASNDGNDSKPTNNGKKGNNNNNNKASKDKYVDIPYGDIFNKRLNSTTISRQVINLRTRLRTQIRTEIQFLGDIYDQLFSMYYRIKLVEGQRREILEFGIVDYVNNSINELNFEKVKEHAKRTYDLFQSFKPTNNTNNTNDKLTITKLTPIKRTLQQAVMETLNIRCPKFFIKDDSDAIHKNGITDYRDQILTIIQDNDSYKQQLSEYIMQRILFCQTTFAEQQLVFDKKELFAIVFEIYVGLLPSYLNHAAHRLGKTNLTDEILNPALLQLMLDNLKEPTQNASAEDKILYQLETYTKTYPQRCQQFYTLMLSKIKYCFENINSIKDIQLPVNQSILNQFYHQEDSSTLQIYKDIYNGGKQKIENFVKYCEQPYDNNDFKIEYCNYINWYRILDRFNFRETNGIVNPNISGIKNIFIKAKQLKLENLDADIRNVFLDGCHITDDGVKQIYQLIFEAEKQLQIDQNVIAKQFDINPSLLNKAQNILFPPQHPNQSKNKK